MTEHKWLTKSSLSVALASLALASTVMAGYLMFELRAMSGALAAQTGRHERGGRGNDAYLAGPVKNRIQKGYGELHTCYLEYLKTNPQLKDGSVTLDWQIDTNGDTLKPEVVRSDIKNAPFENCLAAKIARWQFAPTPVVKYVEHRFNFKNEL
ncbi:AgmX/PglI C-terminal domain-containing protein [Turneriella parva]|uniref:TonB family protein n=1 Tax=Turneriella parva (strain ATCC BAA-1111 / DSM 21527 / NCTC 11395 / H) TaxID=869212 RepID=I4B319_TURPD|nr:AgmX/PglI C-terminal domain-containing protein [Turneriella parva]AFM11676.1 hypothetical protein Turpa_1027 [Turneriella parva DSM 21527]